MKQDKTELYGWVCAAFTLGMLVMFIALMLTLNHKP